LFKDPDEYPEGDELLGRLIRSLERSRHQANFACGGNVPIRSPGQAESTAKYPKPSPPVIIRWENLAEPESSPGTQKTVLSGSASDAASVLALVAACQPATFGHGQQDVLDESYRKAGKLDPSAFSTNFCPYETGIMDAVSAALLNELTENKEHVSLGVFAELYKLNVMSPQPWCGWKLMSDRCIPDRVASSRPMWILHEAKNNSDLW
jgi:hypothetical protein